MAKKRAEPDIADQLRRAIEANGQSLNQLAKGCGVDRGQLSRFLRRERTLTLTNAAKVCRYLGLRLAGEQNSSKGN